MSIALQRRRELRRQGTAAERLLWRLLRTRQFSGLKFRRQHPVEPYILDLYCALHKLAIELDGGQHFTADGMAYDLRRSELLAQQGIRVLRFTNLELFEETEGVVETIRRAVEK